MRSWPHYRVVAMPRQFSGRFKAGADYQCITGSLLYRIVSTRLSPFRVKFKYCLFWWPSFSEVLGVNSACCEEHAVFFPIKNGQFVAEIHLSLFLTPRRLYSDYLRFGFAGLTEGDAPPRLSWMRAIRMLFIYV